MAHIQPTSRSNDAEVFLLKDGTAVHTVPRDERYLRTRLGYEIEIKAADGRWLEEIRIPDHTGQVIFFRPQTFFTAEPELNAIIDAFLTRALRFYLPRTLLSVQTALDSFAIQFACSEGIEWALEETMTRLALAKVERESPDSIGILRKFISYLIAYEYEGLDIDRAAEIVGAKTGASQNQYLTLFTMDPEAGPFTRDEMTVINQVLMDNQLDIPLDTRIIVRLCMDHGLRPIQISLLKRSDFHHNPQNDQYWLNVPRVKQNLRDRRVEFKKRLLDTDVGRWIDQMLADDQWILATFDQTAPPLFQRHIARFIDFDGPILSPRDTISTVLNPHAELYTDARRDYQFHVALQGINWRIRRLEKFLPLSPRTGDSFHIGAYRFRYTLGTASVIEGMTAPEVADRLDHSSTETVKHYFKNTAEMWELIEHATTTRVEQKHFVAAFLTKDPQDKSNIYAADITEKKMFTTVGKCWKGSPCHLEPAVACYSCPSFKPNNDTNAHRRAKEVIEEMAEWSVDQCSEGHIRHVYDDAIAGVEAAIVLSTGDYPVLGIHDCPPSPLEDDALKVAAKSDIQQALEDDRRE